MWFKLQKLLELEEPKPLQNNVYLGSGQSPEPIDEQTIKSKWQLWHTLIKPDEFIEELMSDPDCSRKLEASKKRKPLATEIPLIGKNGKYPGLPLYHGWTCSAVHR